MTRETLLGRSLVRARPLAAAVLLCASSLACDSDVVDATGDAGLVIDVRLAPAAAAAVVDQYTIRIEGPTNRTINAPPGTSRTVEGLSPGTYTVALEGTVGGEVETFGETPNVRVVAGENTTASVLVRDFVPRHTNLPLPATEGSPVILFIGPVAGARSYVVEWWRGSNESGLQSFETESLGPNFIPTASGVHSVRFRARNRFGTLSRRGEALDVSVADGPARLIHRWAFNETGGAGTVLVDDVGGADATIVDVGVRDAVAQNGSVTLLGGEHASADYVSFPSGLISDLEDLTIEIWATPLSVKNWGRIFDFGAAESDFFMMSWSQALNGGSEQVEWRSSLAGTGVVGETLTGTVGPYKRGTQHHIVLTLDDDANPQSVIRVYLDGEFRGSFAGPASLAAIADQRNWLGRSQFTVDETANASYDEIRMWAGALTDDEVLASYTQGPAPNEVSAPEPPPFHLYSTGVDDTGALIGPTARDPHYTLVEWPGAPTPDIIAVPIDGTTEGEDDPNDYPGGAWFENSATARWIGPDSNDEEQDAFGPTGESVYRTTFTVPPGVDLSSIRIEGVWGTDNDGIEIVLNDVEIPQADLPVDPVATRPFVVTGPFVVGLNTLDFRVYNGGGPTGLFIDRLEVSYEDGGAAAVVITPSRVRMGYGGAGVGLTVHLVDGNTALPRNFRVNWTTSDPNVVEVDLFTDMLIATGRGSALVTAYVTDLNIHSLTLLGSATIRVDVAPDLTNPIVHAGSTYAQGPGLNWQASQNLARAYGGHLASIRDDAENQALVHPQFTAGGKWIGFTDQVEEGLYRWSDQSPITFEAWYNGEPNGGASEGCAVHEGAQGGWQDWSCSTVFPAIVEWDWTGDLPLGEVIFHEGRRYAVTTRPLRWVQARNLAESLGGTLLSIDDPEEQAFVATAFPAGLGDYWIGIDDLAEEGRFVGPWGALPLYSNWNVGEPNDSGGEDCGAILYQQQSVWNDFPCQRELYAIIEWGPTSPASVPARGSAAAWGAPLDGGGRRP